MDIEFKVSIKQVSYVLCRRESESLLPLWLVPLMRFDDINHVTVLTTLGAKMVREAEITVHRVLVIV